MATSAKSTTGLDADLTRIYRLMLLTRVLDERVWSLSQQGRIGITGPVRGHEAAQLGSIWALRPGQDVVYPYYRDIGVALALGMTPLDILLGALDKADDPFCGARQMPFHYTSAPLRVPSPSTSIATQIPHAVGAALASRLRGEDAATIVYFGDGAASKGDFHEGLSFAAIHKLPIVFFCENNQYAISVPLRLQTPTGSVADRAGGYGVPGARFDGTSVEETYEATRDAVERARAGRGPSLLEAVCYRLGPHTSHDDDTRYRTRDEVATWQARDPVVRARASLLERGLLSVEAERELADGVRREIDEALTRAEAAPDPTPTDAFGGVLADYVVPDPFGRAEGRAARRIDTEGIGSTGAGAPPP